MAKTYDFIVFGGTGLQGRICARDLLESRYSVLLVGRDFSGIQDLLKRKNAGFLKVDLRDEQSILSALRTSGARVVVNCAELTFNVSIMRACLKANVSCTDLGGLHDVTREQFKLDGLFKNKDILCITGCGSTPGIANVMASTAVRELDSATTIMLGFAWDSNKKTFVVPYSIESIFDEFTPAPIILRNGTFVKEDREKSRRTFDFREVGKQTVQAIVHSEVYTFAKYFKSKGVKNVQYMAGFPEHSMTVIRMLMDLGFSGKESLYVEDTHIRPIEFTSRVLKQLPLPEGYQEVENIWVRIAGEKDGKKKEVHMECIVKTQKGWEHAGSNVNTGRTISIISQMLLEGKIQGSGVHAPEGVVPDKEFFEALGKRKMFVYEGGKRLN